MYCFIGICELYRATGNRKYLDAAIALAQNIREEELFVTGTGSREELWFHGADAADAGGASSGRDLRHGPLDALLLATAAFDGRSALCRRDGDQSLQRPARRA